MNQWNEKYIWYIKYLKNQVYKSINYSCLFSPGIEEYSELSSKEKFAIKNGYVFYLNFYLKYFKLVNALRAMEIFAVLSAHF